MLHFHSVREHQWWLSTIPQSAVNCKKITPFRHYGRGRLWQHPRLINVDALFAQLPGLIKAIHNAQLERIGHIVPPG
jgi:hypothetical protein